MESIMFDENFLLALETYGRECILMGIFYLSLGAIGFSAIVMLGY
jgi:hypothetical protein